MKNAYEQLMAEGYIYGMEKRGYYVSPVQRPLAAQRLHHPPQRLRRRAGRWTW